MERYFDRMKLVIESHGGTVEKFIGDAIMAVFGVPEVHEDDALRAVARPRRDARGARPTSTPPSKPSAAFASGSGPA